LLSFGGKTCIEWVGKPVLNGWENLYFEMPFSDIIVLKALKALKAQRQNFSVDNPVFFHGENTQKANAMSP
jgi:hypothetical protein